MHYEINVSKNGTHFFATHERSITYELRAQEVYDVFKRVFPPEQGYEITVTRYESVGRQVKFE